MYIQNVSSLKEDYDMIRRDQLDELEARALIDNTMRKAAKMYALESGKLVQINEVIRLREFSALLGLIIAYSAGSFMSLDRFKIEDFHPVRYKRIINRLNCQSGQIQGALMMELLRIRDKTKLSKYDIIRKIQKKYFNSKPIGTKDITESLNRMLRKTFDEYFWFDGRYFRKGKFDVRIIQLPPETRYEIGKITLDNVIKI